MKEDASFPAWLMRDTNWSRAGLPMAVALLLLAPLVRRGVGRAPFLVYLQLPAYMIHQYEEHAHGAFQREMNATLPPVIGRLTDSKIFWSNVAGVWGVDTAAFYLATTTNPATGLVAPYLAIVNGLLHVASAVGLRRYSPGLWTALLIFLPFGTYSARAIGRESGATLGTHAAGIAAALFLHLLVVISVVRTGRRQQGTTGK